MSKKLVLNLVLDIAILILLITITYSWMITEATVGENVEYNKTLVVTDSDVQVSLYVMQDNEYMLQSPYLTEPIINTKLLEPGKNQKYRFDITNNNDVSAAVKIVFTEISGDINVLQDYILFTNTSPDLISFSLKERVKYNEEKDYYYFDYLDYLSIPAHQTISLYFNISLLSSAQNDVMSSNININKVMFIKP